MIYFAQAGPGLLVKIGTSRNVVQRRSMILSPEGKRVKILGTMPGSFAEEKVLHRKFARIRDVGEWFRPTKRLLKFIAQNSSDGPSPPIVVRLRWRAVYLARIAAAYRNQDLEDWLNRVVLEAATRTIEEEYARMIETEKGTQP